VPRTKGTTFVWVVKFLRANRQRAQALLPPELQHYLDARVLPSTWYPIADYWGLMRAVTAIAELGDETYPQLGRFLARTDLAGIYKSSVKPGDPARTVAAAAALWKNYHDRGELVVEPDGASACLITLRDYPEPSRELCGLLDGYLPELAVTAGAREVEFRRLSCRAERGPDCRWRVSWEA
jgi:hypothetical protein